jgi:hypothetical protein
MPEAGANTAALRKAAEDFADELNTTLGSALPDCPSFHAVQLSAVKMSVTTYDGVRVDSPVRISLFIDGEPTIGLDVRFRCTWDSAGQYLAVDTSSFKVYATGINDPLFRVEYDRPSTSWPPGAHFHVHGHRNEIAWLQRLSERGRPGEKTAKMQAPRMAEVHFPVGGHRMRPGLEDLLWILAEELDIDLKPGGKQVLADAVKRWRERQLAAAVRDRPDVAARVLTDLGWQITPPEDDGQQATDAKLHLP